MIQSIRAGVALPAIVLTLTLAGCASGSQGARATNFAGSIDKSNIGLALRAQQAITSGDVAGGIALAEQAVANRPTDAGFRTLLGNAYLSSGRFASAETAYRDTLTLLPEQQGIPLKLILSVIAQGKSAEALALLDQVRGIVNPADVGLALALAGQPGNAIAVLDEAARAPGADSRVRQNLALAHALGGDWAAARAIAAQDLPADEVDVRIAQWMQFAKPGSNGVQVASLIGVAPALSDAGQPVRLALRPTDNRLAAVVAPAALEPSPEPTVIEHQVVATGTASAPQPAEMVSAAEPAPAPVATEVAAPLPVAIAEAAPPPPLPAVSLEAIRREPVRASGALPRASELRRAAAIRFAGSARSVVQLGAYGSVERVQSAWADVVRRHPSMARYTPASAMFASAKGRVFRLSVKGFSSDREARLLCQSLQSKGRSCFVRSPAGDQTVRFAAR